MAKKNNSRRRRRQMTLPVALIIGMFPLVHQMRKGYGNEGLIGAGKEAVYSMTGFHSDTGKFDWSYMNNGLFPILAGGLVHWFANRVGINRTLSSARIPLIRL